MLWNDIATTELTLWSYWVSEWMSFSSWNFLKIIWLIIVYFEIVLEISHKTIWNEVTTWISTQNSEDVFKVVATSNTLRRLWHYFWLDRAIWRYLEFLRYTKLDSEGSDEQKLNFECNNNAVKRPRKSVKIGLHTSHFNYLIYFANLNYYQF